MAHGPRYGRSVAAAAGDHNHSKNFLPIESVTPRLSPGDRPLTAATFKVGGNGDGDIAVGGDGGGGTIE